MTSVTHRSVLRTVRYNSFVPTEAVLYPPEHGNVFLVEALVPAHAQAVLPLAIFGALVVVSLELHQRSHDVLVVVPVLVLEQYRLGARNTNQAQRVEIALKIPFCVTTR